MKHKNKGFTLVELIVVLVILAILAALLIPALTGYIDKAKEKKIVAETRMVVMVSLTLARICVQLSQKIGHFTQPPDQQQQVMENTYRKSKNSLRYLIPIRRQLFMQQPQHRVRF